MLLFEGLLVGYVLLMSTVCIAICLPLLSSSYALTKFKTLPWWLAAGFEDPKGAKVHRQHKVS